MAADNNTNTEGQPVLSDQTFQVQEEEQQQEPNPNPKSSQKQDQSQEEWPYLDVHRHLRYWKMCIRAPLPHVYLSNESSRLALAYFIVNSITLLTPPPSERIPGKTPEPLISREDKKLMRKWVLHHQRPTGGFCGTSSLVFPLSSGYDTYNNPEKKKTCGDEEPEHAGLANITYTLFALQLLALLADEEDEEAGAEKAFEGVNRTGTLRWLKSLQREDGSFGEALSDLPGHGRFIAGGYDMRYCYIATAIRWILRGDVKEGEAGWVEDFDTEKLARYILNSQTYDRGFAGNSRDEAHAGYAYCAIAALTLLDRPLSSSSPSSPSSPPKPSPLLHSSIRDLPGLIHWLASRPFVYLDPPPPPQASEDPDNYIYQEDDLDDPNFLLPPTPADLLCRLDSLSREKGQKVAVAFNGRTNKVADTCYFWWVGGALANLVGHIDNLVDGNSARRFLLEKMQHRIGGFGKSPGSPPDLYHSFFGLAVLGLLGHEGEEGKVRRIDPGLAVPKDVVGVIEKARAKLVEREGEKKEKREKTGKEAVGMGLELRGGGERPKWLGSCGY